MKNELLFEVNPYIGIGPIKFGMSKTEVTKLLGKPDTSEKDFIGRTDERRGMISVKYNDKGKVNEVSFSEGVTVLINNHDILNDNDIIKYLEIEDKAFNTIGFKVFFKYGIAITGYSKKKESKSVSVFAKELEAMWRM